MKIITAQDKIERDTVKLSCGCQIWLKGETAKGYGQLNWRGKVQYAHRFSYKTFIEDPVGWQVLHTCHNKLCVAPRHLYLGTAEDNARDAKLNGDLRKRTGSNIKLSIEEVQAIRRLLEERKVSRKHLAKLFKISEATLSEIASRRTWKDV